MFYEIHLHKFKDDNKNERNCTYLCFAENDLLVGLNISDTQFGFFLAFASLHHSLLIYILMWAEKFHLFLFS